MMALTIFLSVFFIPTSYPLNNGLAQTPQMGWSSKLHFGCNINETLIQRTTDLLVATGLAAAGYKYVNLDDCWQGDRNAQGSIQADPKTFPSGIRALADYIHSKQLKLGVFSSPESKTWNGRSGSYGHEKQDANSYASWTVDYLTYEESQNNDTDPHVGFPLMRDALNASGRAIFYSIMGDFRENLPLWAMDVANSWSSGGYIGDNWHAMLDNIDMNNQFADYAGVGGWNDPEILQVGNGGMTDAEYVTHFSLWAIAKAPVLIGGDLSNMSTSTLAILTNPEVIAVNQDSLGVQGKKVGSLWSTSSNSSTSVAINNCSSFSSNAEPIRHQWEYHSVDGSIRSVPYGRCLSIENCDTSEAAVIVVTECHINDPQAKCQGKNQQWAVDTLNHTIFSRWNGKCLDVNGGHGPSVIAYTCYGGDNQRWIWSALDGTVRSKLNEGQCLTEVPELELWTGPLADGSSALVLLNRGNSISEPITVLWRDVGFSINRQIRIRDLWARKDLGTYNDYYTSPNIDPHSVMMLKAELAPLISKNNSNLP